IGDKAERRVALFKHHGNRVHPDMLASSSVVGLTVAEVDLANISARAQLKNTRHRAIDNHLDQFTQRKFVQVAIELHVASPRLPVWFPSYHRSITRATQ